MRTAAILIGAVIVILLMPATLDAIGDFRMTDHTDEFNTTTAAGVTTANLTLSQELYGDETRNVSLSSNFTSDAPIASAYTSSTQVLYVTGLTADSSRRLTIEYKIDALSDYTGAGIATKVWPLLLILGVIGMVVAAVYNATRKGD